MQERILQAAAQEMNSRGVKFTVEAVAERVGISKKTIYQHFSSKDAVITALVEGAVADMRRQEQLLLADPTLDFVERLAALLVVEPQVFGPINDWVKDDIRRYRPADWEIVEAYRREVRDLIRQQLEDGIAAGKLRPIHPGVATRMLTVACSEFLQYATLQEEKITFGDAMRAMREIFLHGIVAGKAEE